MTKGFAMHSDTAERQVSRRTFFSYVIVAVGGFVTAATGIPLIGSLILPTLRKRTPGWVSAGALSEFPVGQPRAVTVTVTSRDGWMEKSEAKGVWVVRHGQDSFTVFNGRCVHLGCAFSWQEAQKEFLCPCHGGRYSLDGKVLGGPPPRPLDTLEWRVEQGNLMIQYQDFRLGVSQKEVA